jgi:hypothetical protein
LDLHCTLVTYADDTTLICNGIDPINVAKLLNKDLQTISLWFYANRLLLNANKSSYILLKTKNDQRKLPLNSIKIDGIYLKYCDKVRLLGFYLDEHLSFRCHVDHLCNKLSYVNSVLLKLRLQGLPTKCLINIYKTLFVPHISNGNLIWGFAYKKQIKRVQVMQNNAMRCIFGVKMGVNLSEYYKKNELLYVKQLTILRSNVFIFKTVLENDNLFGSFFKKNIYGNISNERLFLPGTYLEPRRKSIFFSGIEYYNSLDLEIRKSGSVHIFRTKCTKRLLSDAQLE